MTNSPLKQGYIGRFAPSPSGDLHFGSLVAALASYLDAKAHGGQWLVRMEDIDPPREVPGAAASILRTLEAHHLFWDQTVLYQSQRLEAYAAAIEHLRALTYPCNCTRQRLLALPGAYDGHCCKHRPPKHSPQAIRLRTDKWPNPAMAKDVEYFDDIFLGPQHSPLAASGDFILRRKDGLFAYQLAVAVDDHYQGITHIIRGADLLDSTSRQRYLLALLKAPLPHYGHTPLALGCDGHKLSKQNHASPLDTQLANRNLLAALHFLGHSIPTELDRETDCNAILAWAIYNWRRQAVPHT
jgi:glutamyl-Q tRNA(Asp) synthetase